MNDNYLDDLPLSAEAKTKIVHLGLPNAVALLAMIQAAPEAFTSYLDSNSIEHLTTALRAQLTEGERAILDAPQPRFNATGAMVSQKAPTLPPPKYDLALRNRIFEQLQRLRKQPNPSPANKRRIAELEQNLNTLLES